MTATPAMVAQSESPHPDGRRPGRAARAANALIRLYQRLFAWRPSPCRYWPTCSEYAREAIEIHGLWRGARLAVRRLARCRPLAPSGFDPVPPLAGSRSRGPAPS